MKNRPISKDKYIIAGVITVLVFSLGLTLGFLFESYRNSWIEKVNKDQENNYQSLQLQYYYLTSLKEKGTSCPVLFTTLEKTLEDLSNSLSEFMEYETDSKLNKEEFELAGRKYLLDNLRYWMFAQEAKQKCDLDIVPILYFYSEDCSICPSQGTILTYYRKVFDKKVLVFPLNSRFQGKEAMRDVLASEYNITQYPTLVVDGKKYEGFIGKDELKTVICASLKNETSCQ